jgi:hypothetical protein
MRGMAPLGSDIYVSPVGSSWEEVKINEKAVAAYRFDPSGYARIKSGIDVAAVIYLTLAFLALIIARPTIQVSHSAFLAGIGRGFTLQPLLFAHGPQAASSARYELFVFILLVIPILLHESQWLKLQIYFKNLEPGRSYEGFLKASKPTSSARQLSWTVISSIVNHLFLLGVLLTGASLLWDLRLLRITNPVVLPSIHDFGGRGDLCA